MSSNFLLREHALWDRDNDLFLWGLSTLYIFWMSLCFDEQTFSGSLLFPVVAMLNWFTKSARFEEGFNDKDLLWSFSKSIYWVVLLSVFVQQARKFLLLDKEECCAATFYAIPTFVAVLRYL